MAALSEALAAITDQPDIKHIVSVSGGKDSAALAVYLRQNYPEIPAEYVFCDTCCELPETDEYIKRLEGLLGKQVARVTALETLKIRAKPGRNPFDIWLREVYGGFLPSPRSRWCTRVLKIEPFERYVGDRKVFSYIGIRADEDRDGYRPKKPPKLSERPNIVPVYPFKDDGIQLAEVKRILEESGLGLPKYYEWRSRSGCYFCFYQQIGEWQGLLERHPDLFEKAKEYETKLNGKQFTWVDGRTLDDIERMPRHEVPSMDEVEGCAIVICDLGKHDRMNWQDTLAGILIKAGNPNLQGIINEGAHTYLVNYDLESQTDPIVLLEALIDVWGPKLLESRNIRDLMLETLDPSSLKVLAGKLEITITNDFAKEIVQRISAVSWSWGSSKVRSFCDHFNISGVIDDYTEQCAGEGDAAEFPSVVSGKSYSDRFLELHTFQSDVRDRLLSRYVLNNEQKILLQLPTGGGKTRVALHTVIRYLTNNDGPRKGVLWLAYEPLLLSQALATFLKLWPTIGVGDIEIRCLYDRYRDSIDSEGPVIYFASVQSLTNRFDDATKSRLRKSLLITVFDEAHQIVANQARTIINALVYQNDGLKLLGLTATPGRNYFNDIENERFRNYFSNNIKIEPPPKPTAIGDVDDISGDDRTAITYLQENGVLAKLDHDLLDYGMQNRPADSSSTDKDFYTSHTLKKLAKDPARNNLIVESISNMVSQRKKILVFACSVQHAEDISFFLRLRGLNVGLILGKNKDVRNRTISRFRKTDDLNVLVNYGVLTTGFDAPEIDAVLIARPTSSLVTYSQMLGRALRGPMNGGHERNTVINVSDPIFGEENEAYKKFEIYWRDYE